MSSIHGNFFYIVQNASQDAPQKLLEAILQCPELESRQRVAILEKLKYTKALICLAFLVNT